MIVTPPDMETWLCSHIRTIAPAIPGLQVDSTVPDGYRGEYPLIRVRDDSGAKTSAVTFDRSIGVSVYTGSKQDAKPGMDLARTLMARLMDADAISTAPGSPIAAVEQDGCNGPYSATDSQDTAVSYFTLEYSVVGDEYPR
jgi:hypothetical protein